jgi:hypothetical protein
VINANIPESNYPQSEYPGGPNIRESKYGRIICCGNGRWLQGPERRSADMTHKTDPQEAPFKPKPIDQVDGTTSTPGGTLASTPVIFACRPACRIKMWLGLRLALVFGRHGSVASTPAGRDWPKE